MGYASDMHGWFRYAPLVTEYESFGKIQTDHLTVKFRRLCAYIAIHSTVSEWNAGLSYHDIESIEYIRKIVKMVEKINKLPKYPE